MAQHNLIFVNTRISIDEKRDLDKIVEIQKINIAELLRRAIRDEINYAKKRKFI